MSDTRVSPPNAPGTRRWLRLLLVTGGILVAGGTLLVCFLTMLSVTTTLEQRLDTLEHQVQPLVQAQPDQLSREVFDARTGELQTQVTGVQQQYTDLAQTVTTLQDGLAQLQQTVGKMASPSATPDSELAARLDRLEQQVAQLRQTLPGQETVAPAAGVAARNTPAAEKSVPRPPVRRAVSVSPRNTPFTLTAVEYRGGRALAALAPAGASRLSQVHLLPPGGVYQGWTLNRIHDGSAVFSRQGRTLTLQVHQGEQ